MFIGWKLILGWKVSNTWFFWTLKYLATYIKNENFLRDIDNGISFTIFSNMFLKENFNEMYHTF